MGVLATVVLLLAVLLIALQVGGGSDSDNAGNSQESPVTTPLTPQDTQSPFAVPSPAERECAECHGYDPGGEAPH